MLWPRWPLSRPVVQRLALRSVGSHHSAGLTKPMLRKVPSPCLPAPTALSPRAKSNRMDRVRRWQPSREAMPCLPDRVCYRLFDKTILPLEPPIAAQAAPSWSETAGPTNRATLPSSPRQEAMYQPGPDLQFCCPPGDMSTNVRRGHFLFRPGGPDERSLRAAGGMARDAAGSGRIGKGFAAGSVCPG